MPEGRTGDPSPTIGIGTAAGLGVELAKRLGRPGRCLLVLDAGIAGLPEIGALHLALAEPGHDVETWSGFSANPLASEIDAGLALARLTPPDAVIGVGGGSALDVAKLVAALAGSALATLEIAEAARPLPARRPLLALLPTTAGTGSEATSTAVFSDAAHTKRWAWGEALRPDLAILDAALTRSLPPWLTAATGLDAFVHALEAATNAKATGASRAAADRALAVIPDALPAVIASPGDLEAREALLVAAHDAGRAIDIAGTAMAHAIGHALAGLIPVHHGRAVALGLAAALPWIAEGAPEAHARAARVAGWGRGTQSLVHGFRDLAMASGLALGLDAAERAAVSPEALSRMLARSENAPMVAATRRQATPADLTAIAEAVCAYP
ncbi:MAG: iron-containing alcohol dehydrogenase [Azospirillaceae bacterium]